MERSPYWEANWFSASQEIPCILWNLKFHDHIHKCLPLVPILSQINAVLASTSHFLRIYLNIVLPSAPGSSKWSVSLRFPHQNLVYTLPLSHTCYMELIFRWLSRWSRRQHVPLQHWNAATRLHGFRTQKTTLHIFMAVKLPQILYIYLVFLLSLTVTQIPNQSSLNMKLKTHQCRKVIW